MLNENKDEEKDKVNALDPRLRLSQLRDSKEFFDNTHSATNASPNKASQAASQITMSFIPQSKSVNVRNYKNAKDYLAAIISTKFDAEVEPERLAKMKP